MIQGNTTIRVRYGEVDQMGFLYYGHYAWYYEVARAEMIRELGYPYRDMELDGVVMPVVNLQSKYLRPARYDELIRIETTIRELHQHPFLTFQHKFYNEQNLFIHSATVTLTFMNPASGKRVPMPSRLEQILKPYF